VSAIEKLIAAVVVAIVVRHVYSAPAAAATCVKRIGCSALREL
jgi:hypothetical protein